MTSPFENYVEDDEDSLVKNVIMGVVFVLSIVVAWWLIIYSDID